MTVGYFSKDSTSFRMRRGAIAEIGVVGSGPVLRGAKSIETVMAEDAARVAFRMRREREKSKYYGVEEYDPVLRSHCRL